MLINLAMCSYMLFYRLKNDNFNYKNNLKFIFEVVTQIILMIVSFSLMVFDFYILLILASNIIYIIYVSSIFEQRMDVEYEINTVV